MPSKSDRAVLTTVECPNCHARIPLEEALLGPLRDQLSQQLRAEWEAEVEGSQSSALQELQTQLDAAQAKSEELTREQRELKRKELLLRQEREKLITEREDFELAVQRAIDSKRQELSKDAAKRAEEAYKLKIGEYELKLKEGEEQNRRLQASLKEAHERASQVPSELRGTAQELKLDEILRERFPEDDVERVGKGARGADVVQSVRASTGSTVGRILWESKRAKRFDKTWIPRLKENASRQHADLAVLVTLVQKEESDPDIAQHDGVWVVPLSLAEGVAELLRSWLLGVARTQAAVVHRDELSGRVYDYVTGPVFKRHMEGVFRGIHAEWTAIQRERSAQEKRWSEREAAIHAQARHLAQFIGDLGGTGAELVSIKSLELPVGSQ